MLRGGGLLCRLAKALFSALDKHCFEMIAEHYVGRFGISESDKFEKPVFVTDESSGVFLCDSLS